MPLARIDLLTGKSDEYRRTIGAVVYETMVEILKAPVDDRFQVISEHSPANMIFDPHFFGIDRSEDCVFIQLTLVEGRSLDQKARFYERLVEELRARIGLRPEDIFVSLVSTAREDWSFGNGRASLAS